MFARNRVIWSEGLFIKPQHFQQHQRYSEYLLEERLTSVSKYLYGIAELSLNPEYLAFGRIAIERAVGVMPDGTAFRIPQEDVMPEALEIEDGSLSNHLIYLAIPLRSESIMEVNWLTKKGQDVMKAAVSTCEMFRVCKVIQPRLMYHRFNCS